MSFKLTGNHDRSVLFSGIEKSFRMIFDKSDVLKSRMYDTFDWRLYGSNCMLLNADTHSMILRDLPSGRTLCEESTRYESHPRFWWDFQDTELKRSLKDILGVRALIRIIDFEKKSDLYSVLNEDQKTVARIAYRSITGFDTAGRQCRMDYIEIIPLRGYDKESKIIQNSLKQIQPEYFTENPVLVFIRACGIEPGGYTSRITVSLSPDERCDQAMKVILTQMLTVIKANENGIKEDIDTEFLHDFRVAVRRTRAALGQIRDVFPPEIRSRFREDFNTLGKRSNRLRDLDVYLLDKNTYLEMMPETLRPGLLPLFQSIERERRGELLTFTKTLNEPRYKRILDEWELFLNSEHDSGVTPTKASRPVVDVAKELILRRHKNIISSGKNIDATTPDKKLHSLRIQCKKLRYLLEFFSSLFPLTETGIFIKKFKKIQDNLGIYNDLFVQQEDLKKYLENIPQKSTTQIEEAAAIGGLIALLKKKQDAFRSRFKTVFEEFSNKENTALFYEIFGRTGGRAD